VSSGIVTQVDTHNELGLTLDVKLVDGRDVDARPMFPGASGRRGVFGRIAAGDEVVVLFPDADLLDPIAFLGPTSSEQTTPAGWSNDRTVVADDVVEVRSGQDGDDGLEHVVTHEALVDLKRLVEAVEGIVTALGSGTPVPNDGGAAYKAAIGVSMTASGVQATLADVKARLTTSTTAIGDDAAGAPHASPVLRAATKRAGG
jgi:hypothetical protein